MKQIISYLFLIGLLCGMYCPLSAQSFDIRYYGNHIYIPSNVNGQKANLVFDTGAELIYLDSTFISGSGLSFKRIGNARLGGVGLGTRMTKIIFGDVRVVVAGSQYQPQYVPVVDLRPILGDMADGLFGLKEVADNVVFMDMNSEKMSLINTLTPEMAEGYTRIEIEYSSRKILIPLTVVIDSNTIISGKAMMDIRSGQGIEFTSKTADKHRLELIADKKPFHYVNGGIGGESYGFEIGISRAELPGVDVNADYARFSTDDSGALASDEYIAIIGNRIWEQFSIILDIKNNSLYLKKLPSTHL